jgi:cytoskeleton protein RodZ
MEKENRCLPPFGDKLKKAREQGGITLDDVALTTKIGTRFLRAMEEEHFEQLPGGIFNKGFIRAYARCVGLDEDQIIADYLMASGEVQLNRAEVVDTAPVPPATAPAPRVGKSTDAPAEKAEERRDASGDGSNFPWVPAMSLALLVMVLGLAIRHFWSRASVGVWSASSSSTKVPVPATTAPRSTGMHTASPASAANSAVPDSSPSGTPLVVLIKANEDSWILITADGKPIFEDTLEAFEQKSVGARSNVVIKAGNLGGLDFWFNGKKMDLQGAEGEVKTLTFDAHGLRPQAPKSHSADPPAPSP